MLSCDKMGNNKHPKKTNKEGGRRWGANKGRRGAGGKNKGAEADLTVPKAARGKRSGG